MGWCFMANKQGVQKFLDDKSEFLVKRYSRYIDSAAETYKQTKGRDMPNMMRRNLALTLDNTNELLAKKRKMDTTFSSDISFTNYAFDIVSVILPSLITEEIVSVQAMDRRAADIFFMNYLAANSKGAIKAGDTLMSSRTGWKPNWGTGAFASGWINNEPIGEGGTANITGTVQYFPLKAGNTVTVVAGSAVLTGMVGDSGNVTFSGGGSGTLNPGTGEFDITFTSALASGVPVTASYKVDTEVVRSAIGSIKIEITSDIVRAETMKLNAEWLMDAAYDLQKAHGRDAEKEILIALTGEVKAEIDTGVIMDLYNNATAGSVSWDKTPPAGVQWFFHKETLMDVFINQSTNIYTSTRRAVGNFIVVGTAVHDVVQVLDKFKSAISPNQEFTGPFFSGVLADRWKIFVSPDLDANSWFQGYIGENYLKSGYVYAPYLPLFTTQTREFEDFTLAKGLGSSYGTYLINGGLYSKGSMTSS
jgi:hypothetical protein